MREELLYSMYLQEFAQRLQSRDVLGNLDQVNDHRQWPLTSDPEFQQTGWFELVRRYVRGGL